MYECLGSILILLATVFYILVTLSAAITFAERFDREGSVIKACREMFIERDICVGDVFIGILSALGFILALIRYWLFKLITCRQILKIWRFKIKSRKKE